MEKKTRIRMVVMRKRLSTSFAGAVTEVCVSLTTEEICIVVTGQ